MGRDLELDVLRTFLAICDEGSFRGAADRIGRSQSAVSIQVQKLEQLVGQQLIVRERPAIKLTPKGSALLSHAHRILRLQDEVMSDLREGRAGGQVRFGMPDDYAFGLLPRILAEFSKDEPTIEVSIVCATSPELERMLAAEQLDVAVVSKRRSKHSGDFLKDEPIVWVSAPRYAPHKRNPLPLAVFQEDCAIRRNAVAALESNGLDYRICYSSPNLAALCAVVGAGLAIAAMPRSSVPKNLEIIAAELPPLPSIEVVVLKSTGLASEAVSKFLRCLGGISWI